MRHDRWAYRLRPRTDGNSARLGVIPPPPLPRFLENHAMRRVTCLCAGVFAPKHSVLAVRGDLVATLLCREVRT